MVLLISSLRIMPLLSNLVSKFFSGGPKRVFFFFFFGCQIVGMCAYIEVSKLKGPILRKSSSFFINRSKKPGMVLHPIREYTMCLLGFFFFFG